MPSAVVWPPPRTSSPIGQVAVDVPNWLGFDQSGGRVDQVCPLDARGTGGALRSVGTRCPSGARRASRTGGPCGARRTGRTRHAARARCPRRSSSFQDSGREVARTQRARLDLAEVTALFLSSVLPTALDAICLLLTLFVGSVAAAYETPPSTRNRDNDDTTFA